jgi:hypothetical protein
MTTTSMAATPAKATHSGIVYPGELVRTPTWQIVLGRPLTGGVYFRNTVQANDLTGLADVLDHKVVKFIHTLVSGQSRSADG